jgi:6-pyruvoyltetrahydropterin/6-carboxytetrahydropterin synthase
MVADFSNLKRLVNSSVISELDHKNLNEVVPCIPTCENLAGWIATSLSKHLPEPINQITVQLREGKGGWATYELKLR